MSTPWGTSPFATPTPVIDSVTRNTVPAPTPIPIPGLMPLPFPQFTAPQAPAPYPGVQPLPFSQFAAPQTPLPYMGFQPLGFPQTPTPYTGVPSLGFPYAGGPPLGFPYMGYQPLPFPQYTAPQGPAPYLGFPPVPFPQYTAPQGPAPYTGVPSLSFHPAMATLGFDMQTTPWAIESLGSHAVFPVVSVLLSQLGLREAISRIGDEALKQRVTNSINEAIDRTIEGVSGMTLHPWFGPGAQSMIYPIAGQLALIAQRYPEGAVREGLLTIAGQILHKSIAPTGEGAGRHR